MGKLKGTDGIYYSRPYTNNENENLLIKMLRRIQNLFHP